jgi:hypothetical protein
MSRRLIPWGEPHCGVWLTPVWRFMSFRVTRYYVHLGPIFIQFR